MLVYLNTMSVNLLIFALLSTYSLLCFRVEDLWSIYIQFEEKIHKHQDGPERYHLWYLDVTNDEKWLLII